MFSDFSFQQIILSLDQKLATCFKQKWQIMAEEKLVVLILNRISWQINETIEGETPRISLILLLVLYNDK